MTGFFAPPTLLAAVAGYSDPDPGRTDADLLPGAHLRLLPSQLLGFPIAPFLVWIVEPNLERLQPVWTNPSRTRLAGPNLSNGEIACLLTPPVSDETMCVGVEVLMAGDAAIEVSAFDVSGRLLARRSRPRYMLGVPDIRTLRIRGQGQVEAVIAYMVGRDQIMRVVEGQEPIDILSLPVKTVPRYAGGLGRGKSLERVEYGAPRRLNPMDRPTGPYDPVSPQDEVDRVHALAQGIDTLVASMLDDDGQPAWKHRLVRDTGPVTLANPLWQKIDAQTSAALLLQGLDPGLGRYLGLMNRIESPVVEPPGILVACGAFAFDPDRELPGSDPAIRHTLADRIGPPHPDAAFLMSRFASRFGDFDLIAGRLRDRRHRVEPFVTAALVAPLPDLPRPPDLVLGEARWLTDQAPSAAWRQEFLLSDVPWTGLCAFSRRIGTTWQSLHEPKDDSAQRRRAMLPGTGRTAGTVTLSDAPVPADEAPILYRVRLGDLFGRFGRAAEIESNLPARPKPPRPALMVGLDLAKPDHDSSAPASPGKCRVQVATPDIEQLGAGSLPLSGLKLEFEGFPSVMIPVTSELTVQEYTLPPLTPGDRREPKLVAKFLDSANTESEPAETIVRYADMRHPQPVRTARGLIWSSRPGADAEVEMRLGWQGRPGERYKVFLTDARSLGIDPSGLTRAGVAKKVGALASVDMRDSFRLLTDPPLESTNGRVEFVGTLPRSLSTVQAVRVVPITAGGAETDFARCGLVPVAVPSDRAPPPPTVTTSLDAATGRARIVIAATGLDVSTLAIAEPGLFNSPPDAGALRPEFRLRRAIGRVTEPFYARECARGLLEPVREGAAVRFAATMLDGPAGGLIPYVRYTWWAEVRMPPERRFALAPGEVPEQDAPPGGDGVAATQQAQLEDAPGFFSASSLPVQAMRVPPTPPSLDDAEIAATTAADPDDADGFILSIDVMGGPTVDPSAVAPMGIKVWTQSGEGPIAAAAPDLILEDGNASLTIKGRRVSNALPDVTVHLAVIDPLRRVGRVTAVMAETA